ncbi:curli production assembly/transport protein CsgG [Candidatus Pacearchaeota archaeon]|nr:curli production assembly/transport protein CsgG [Candidatus Pacearchaeota archaeon]
MYNKKFYKTNCLLILCLAFLTACTISLPDNNISEVSAARLTKTSSAFEDLKGLPKPSGKILVSVYNFRDQSGQYKQLPSVSSFSTAVTQGSTSILLQALKESGWFTPVEREGLQNLLTERKIIRAALKNQGQENTFILQPLKFSNILLEGGITGYDSNMQTGGYGAKYFGIGGNEQYRVDQVTVHLRAIDVRSGQILNSVSTTKTILSTEIRTGVYNFVSFKRLLELEEGITTNEPGVLCVTEAIEKSVLSLIIEGILDKHWALQSPSDINADVIKTYLKEKNNRHLNFEEMAQLNNKTNEDEE